MKNSAGQSAVLSGHFEASDSAWALDNSLLDQCICLEFSEDLKNAPMEFYISYLHVSKSRLLLKPHTKNINTAKLAFKSEDEPSLILCTHVILQIFRKWLNNVVVLLQHLVKGFFGLTWLFQSVLKRDLKC